MRKTDNKIKNTKACSAKACGSRKYSTKDCGPQETKRSCK